MEHSSSVVSFGLHTEGAGNHQNRFLAIDGTEAIDLGFPCESCTFLFRRVGSAELPISPHEASDRLNAGITTLDDTVVEAISSVVPRADYMAVLTTIRPRLVSPGAPDDYFANPHWRAMGYAQREHDPGGEYYRGRSGAVVQVWPERSAEFYELAVPLYPVDRCVPEAVEDWTARLAKGAHPTALSVAILTGVWGSRSDGAHVVLTHVLLDGHHKMLAAARSGAELGVLALVNMETRPGESWADDHLRDLLRQTVASD